MFEFLSTNICARSSNEEVIVVKEYEAKISDAQKINIQPNIPEVEETKPTLTYSVPSKDYKDGAFEANPLKPLSMSKEKWEKYNSGFVKIGFGRGGPRQCGPALGFSQRAGCR